MYISDCHSRKIIKKIITVLIVVFIVYLLVSVISNYIPFVNMIFLRLKSVLEFGQDNTTNYVRKTRWEFALHLFESNPLFGYGVSSTGVHSRSQIITESGILKKLSETGIVGFLLYYSFCIYCVISNYKKCNINKNKNYSSLALGVISAIFIENIILQVVESVSVYFILMLFFAYLIHESQMVQNKTQIQRE